MKKTLRGSGFRHTLAAVPKFTMIWFVILVLTPPVIIVTMLLSDLISESSRGHVWFFLVTRMPIILLVAAGLAIFTTARLAGPFVALKRAFEDVKKGDLNRRLKFREGDTHLREIETLFDEMMAAIRERAGREGDPSHGGGDRGETSSRSSPGSAHDAR